MYEDSRSWAARIDAEWKSASMEGHRDEDLNFVCRAAYLIKCLQDLDFIYQGSIPQDKRHKPGNLNKYLPQAIVCDIGADCLLDKRLADWLAAVGFDRRLVEWYLGEMYIMVKGAGAKTPTKKHKA